MILFHFNRAKRTFHASLLVLVAVQLAGTISPAQTPSPSPTGPASPMRAGNAEPAVGSQSLEVPAPSPSASPPLKPGQTPSNVLSSTLPPALDQDSVTRLQIFLDNKAFGPGKIDGRWGEFVQLALEQFHAAQGQLSVSEIDPSLNNQIRDISPYTSYTITAEDGKWVGKIPTQPAAMAKVKKALYRSFADFVAERYHTDTDFLRKLNPRLNLDSLKPGSTLRVPNVEPFKIEGVQAIADFPPKPEFAPREITVDTQKRFLELREGGRVLAAFPITPGSKTLPAPIGTWKIVKVTTMPIFRYDKAMLLHGKRSSDAYTIPPGPRNLVGVVWIGLNKKGIGIHGTDHPETIGRTSSHGCIRLANWDAFRLANDVTTGMTVVISGRQPARPLTKQ
jgi:lipoprotein-anchoring transpeptidase ErfK/SrfK